MVSCKVNIRDATCIQKYIIEQPGYGRTGLYHRLNTQNKYPIYRPLHRGWYFFIRKRWQSL